MRDIERERETIEIEIEIESEDEIDTERRASEGIKTLRKESRPGCNGNVIISGLNPGCSCRVSL